MMMMMMMMVIAWLGPGLYDPRVKTEKGNLMTVHDARFPKPPDEHVPGPGTYTVRSVTLCCCFHVQLFVEAVRILQRGRPRGQVHFSDSELTGKSSSVFVKDTSSVTVLGSHRIAE